MFKLIKYIIVILLFGFIINSLPDSMFNSTNGEEVQSAEDSSSLEVVVDRTQHLITSVDWAEVTERAVNGLNQAAMMLSNYLESGEEGSVSIPTYNESVTEQNNSRDENQVHEFERRVHELVNEERQKEGLEPLEFSVDVSHVARAKSQDMAENNYFSHESPTYGSPFDMMTEFGVHYWSAGENIAMGQRTPEQVMDGWMNSDGHRANILQGKFTHIGVGLVQEDGTYYWTQMFIGK